MLKRLKLKLKNQNNPLLSQRVDNLGLTLIGLISLGYCCFADRFAELNFQLPFLNFPIFIGEIFLFVCLLLLFFKWENSRQKLTVWGFVALVYVAFILYKAITGYFEWGPLALRHAALFYYPLFAVAGYFFFRNEYFTGRKVFFLIVLFIFILVYVKKFFYFVEWGRIACVTLLLILIIQQASKKIRYFLFLVLFICVPYRLIFLGCRAMLVSNVVTLFFLLATLPLVVKIKKNTVIGFVIVILILLYLGVRNFSDKNALQSILNLQNNIKVYKKCKADIAKLESSFIMESVKHLRVYNKAITVISEDRNKNFSDTELRLEIEQQLSEFKQKQAKIEQELEKQARELSKLNKTVSLEKEKLLEKKIRGQPIETVGQKAESSSREKIASSQIIPPVDVTSEDAKLALAKRELEKNTVDLLARKKELMQQRSTLKQQLHQLERKGFRVQYKPRDLGPAYGNTIFRILIWQDLIADLVEKKPIFGFAFGKPFRSKKIEVLNIADGEWKRDGWIAAHNSYLEIIYRLGIIGIILILSIFIFFVKLVYMSIINKSISGILLCGVFINLLTNANFMLILELPYHAIPFWSLFGMSLAYLKGFSRK